MVSAQLTKLLRQSLVEVHWRKDCDEEGGGGGWRWAEQKPANWLAETIAGKLILNPGGFPFDPGGNGKRA